MPRQLRHARWLVLAPTMLLFACGDDESVAASVVAPPQNAPPTIAGTPPTSASVGTAYAFTPTASDPDGGTLTFSVSNPPSWATFNSTTGRLQGTPAGGNVGTFANIAISVSDGTESAALPAFSITVVATNRPPTISGTPTTTAIVGTAYTFTPTASDPDGNTLTFGISNRPSWAAFNTTTGRLQGTPTTANVGTSANVTISVNDGQGGTAQLPAFSITIGFPPNRPPTITGSPPTAVLQGSAYTFTPTASDPDGNTLTFSVANAPAWASFNSATGRLSGTPGPGDVGATSGIVITVSDGSLTASLAAFTLTVQAVATGSVTLSWTPPTENTDGSPLNLAGYRIYWGTQQGVYPNSVPVNDPGLTTYVVGNLMPGTYFFVATAVNTAGGESSFSNVTSKTVP